VMWSVHGDQGGGDEWEVSGDAHKWFRIVFHLGLVFRTLLLGQVIDGHIVVWLMYKLVLQPRATHMRNGLHWATPVPVCRKSHSGGPVGRTSPGGSLSRDA
jgi:hypothetical protein